MNEPAPAAGRALIRLVSFFGCTGRRGFFVTALMLYVVVYAAGTVTVVGAVNLGDTDLPARAVPELLRSVHVPQVIAWLAVAIGGFGVVALVVASLALSVRRLHSAGLSGVFVLLYPLLAYVMRDLPWPYALPPLAALFWDLMMIALPEVRRPGIDGQRPEQA